MASQKRTDIWNALLDAEMNVVYWQCETHRFSVQDRGLAVAAAILSSGTAIALFTSMSASPIVGKWFACLAAAATAIHARFFHSGRLKQLTTIATRWKEMAIDYKLLWSELDGGTEIDPKSWRKFEGISQREMRIDESTFRIHAGRLKAAQIRILEARGLQR